MPADLFDKCKTDGGYFGQLRVANDGFFTRPVLDPHPGNRMLYDGKEKIMWSVNNYLGLAGDETIEQVARDALDEYGISAPMGARMMSGNTDAHIAFERELANFSQKQAAILFNYGYLGVIGTINSLTGPDDIILLDKLAHACIVDGSQLSQAQLRVFRHNDMDSLEMVLKRVNRDRKGGILIVAEGTYGMTGDLAKLPEMCELKEKYGARLFIDDAHGVGVMGKDGRGTADHFGVQEKIDVFFGTFAKAFAAIGGFSAADTDVVDWIAYNARTQVFAKSLPMIYVDAMRKTLEMVIAGDDRRARLWENSNTLKNGLRELGYFIGSGEAPICSVFIPLGDKDVHIVGGGMVKYLRENGVFVSAVIYPVIPLGLCMFRMIPTAAHTDEDVNETLKVFKNMRDELGLDLTVGAEDLKKIGKVYGQ